MSLQRVTHWSQMNTRGPEMSFRTSRRCLPQKEQWNSSIQFNSYMFEEAGNSWDQALPAGFWVWAIKSEIGGTSQAGLTERPRSGSLRTVRAVVLTSEPGTVAPAL